jgi:hypothetical protein
MGYSTPVLRLGLAILALQLPIDNSWIHTYFAKYIILRTKGV